MIKKNSQFEKEYFDKVYRNYELRNPLKKIRFYRSIVEQSVKTNKYPHILDIGCAFGKFLNSLNPEWHRFGLDTSDFAISKAQKTSHSITFVKSDLLEIPFERSFNIIAAFDILKHVADLDKVAFSIKSKLAEQGVFVFVVPVYDGPTGPLIQLLDKDTTHIHKKSRYFWLKWTKENFLLDRWFGIYRYLFPWGYYLFYPTKLLRHFSPAIIVICKKK